MGTLSGNANPAEYLRANGAWVAAATLTLASVQAPAAPPLTDPNTLLAGMFRVPFVNAAGMFAK
jgi:hypothetical protein